MRLSRFFGFILLAAFVPVLLLALAGIALEWRDYRRTGTALDCLDLLERGFVVMEKVSFERGPTNAALGDDLPGDPAIAARLQKARDDSDAAVVALRRKLAQSAGEASAGEALPILEETVASLGAARQEVDATRGLPRAARTPERLNGDVRAMFGVVDRFAPAVNLLSVRMAQADPQLAGAVIVAYQAAELREYAGRLGSLFTSALAARQKLTPAELAQIARTRGRIDGQAFLLEVNATQYDGGPAMRAALEAMRQAYLGDGLSYVEGVTGLYLERGDGGITTAAFAERYVPDMGSIVATRDAVLKQMREASQGRRDRALRMLLGAVAAGVVAVGVFALLLRMVRRYVLRPLLRATELTMALAGGQPGAEVPASARRDEIGDLHRALATLRRQGMDRLRLEREREQMIEQLRLGAATDFLTGLLNRSGFYRTSEPVFADAHRRLAPLALIAADIDHFKEVNDRHGHLAGDAVLSEVARVFQAECRKDDVICRYGGEEFLILLPDTDLDDAWHLAERLRGHIADTFVVMPEDAAVQISMSFGVTARRAEDASLDQMIRRADRALYAAKNAGRNRTEMEAGGVGRG